MTQTIDQLSGATPYYAAKINGQVVGGQYLSESIANEHGIKLCKEGDAMIVVPVTSRGQEILLG